jgi:hypothetical protein
MECCGSDLQIAMECCGSDLQIAIRKSCPAYAIAIWRSLLQLPCLLRQRIHDPPRYFAPQSSGEKPERETDFLG